MRTYGRGTATAPRTVQCVGRGDRGATLRLGGKLPLAAPSAGRADL